MLSKINDVKRELFSIGNNFKLLNVVTFNFKGKNDVKLDPIYEQQYSSQKYSNIGTLSTINIRSSDYYVLSFKDRVNNEFISEEIFISYPHLESFKDFMNQAAREIIKKEDKLYTTRGLTEEGANFIFESDMFSSNKKIAIAPAKVDRSTNDREILVNGVTIFLNNEIYCVWADLNTFITLVNIINNELSLERDSAMTMIMAQNYEILNALNGGSSSTYSSGNGGNSSVTRRPVQQRSIFSNSSNRPTVGGRRNTTTNVTQNDTDVPDLEDIINNDKLPFSRPSSSNKTQNMSVNELDDLMNDDDGEEVVTPRKTIKKPKTETKENNDPVISLEDAMRMADEDLDISDLDLDSDD